MQKQLVDILLVDDDLDTCQTLKSVLGFWGYTSIICSVPADLTVLLLSTKPKLLMLDMRISGIDGCDICKKLKNDPVCKDIPVLMMSAHPDAESTCKKAGADNFIAKPFDIDHLAEIVGMTMAPV